MGDKGVDDPLVQSLRGLETVVELPFPRQPRFRDGGTGVTFIVRLLVFGWKETVIVIIITRRRAH